MKRIELLLLFLKLPLDFVAVFLATFTAYFLRFETLTEWRPATEIITFNEYLLISLAFSLLLTIFFALSGLYKKERRPVFEEIIKIFFAASATIAFTILLLFFRREFFASRFIIIAVWILSFVFVSLERQIFQFIHKMLAKKGVIKKNIIIVGDNNSARAIINEFKKDKALGICVLKHYDCFNERVFYSLQNKFGDIDEIILTNPKMPNDEVERVINFSITHHTTLKYSADFFASGSARIEIQTIAGIPLVEIKKTPLDAWGKIFKRAFDIVVSSLLIIITSPVMLISILIIIFESGFPILFRNERIGEKGKKFDVLKFRSMKKEFSIGKQFGNQESALEYEKKLIEERGIKAGPVYKIKDDPRVTRFGKLIRKWSVDEFPQFFNCLFGTMSLVGPRPHQPREVALYDKHHQKIFEIKPGITGLSQISGRSDLNFDDEAKLDIFYIEHWSPKLDLYILFKTPMAVFSKKGVY
ncbi:MAG: sugar transferase [Patescibacteria group bacterium]|nr:sugar transferase [Patescibacteria group bacterium]